MVLLQSLLTCPTLHVVHEQKNGLYNFLNIVKLCITTPFVLLYTVHLKNLPLIAITNTTDLEQSLEPVPPISESPNGVHVE